ncbi:MAG TPA: enoyl-CoA hydratase/isomerase family protein [Caulobacteraceae bacterium]|jgi:enoyl-CoA hydratase|nr:enoyl-CoA hydratase/isomerase family protein [Caulobacteraceae bacterium]
MSDSEPPVIARVEGRAGRLSLNRPRALNALSLEMCQAMTQALLAWRDDPAVEAVMIDHVGERGFCSGGDVRAAVASGEAAKAFFRAEYRLNTLLYRYPKPTVAVMDGIAMGGGLGLAWPCRYRIATERSVLAMPESAIGLFPDVGMGWRLPRLPGHAGLWFALTGARIGPADALLLGLATDYVPSARLGDLKAAFARDPGMVEERLTELEGDAAEPPIGLVRDEIDRLFGQPTLEAVVAALEAEASPWALDQLAALRSASPTTLKVGFRLLRDGARLDRLEDEMALEYAIATRLAVGHDFPEGVRALLVDKDKAPRWDPPTLAAVTDTMIDGLFAPLPHGEEWTPAP